MIGGLDTGTGLRLLEALLLHADLGVYVWRLEDADDLRSFRLIAANPAAARFTGVPTSEIAGRTMPEAFPRLFEFGLPELYRAVILTGRPHDLGEMRYGDDRVRERLYRAKVVPLPPDAVAVLFEDLTSGRPAEEAWRASERRFRTTFVACPVGILLTALDGRFVEVNPAWCAVLGYAEEELRGRHFNEITHPADLEEGLRAREDLLSGRAPLLTFRKRYLRKDGTPVPVELTTTVVRDDAGRPEYFLAVVRDLPGPDALS